MRLRGIGHALVPMKRTAFAIRHEKANSGGYIAYVTEWGPHLLGDVHTRRTSAGRALRRGVKIRGVWARITNGDASFVQWDRILKCSQMSRVHSYCRIFTARMPRKIRRENLWQCKFELSHRQISSLTRSLFWQLGCGIFWGLTWNEWSYNRINVKYENCAIASAKFSNAVNLWYLLGSERR